MGIRDIKFYRDIANYIVKVIPGINYILVREEFCILVIKLKYLKIVMQILQVFPVFLMTRLLDMWVVDCLVEEGRFSVNYLLGSFKLNFQLIVRVYLEENQQVETISDLFDSAEWLEREIYDLFGIYFLNSKNLTRILTDYGFQGHPLKKDFPVIGYIQKKYFDQMKRLGNEVVKFLQGTRIFFFKAPWDKEN